MFSNEYNKEVINIASTNAIEEQNVLPQGSYHLPRLSIIGKLLQIVVITESLIYTHLMGTVNENCKIRFLCKNP